jgi:hypothetical protein
MGGAHSTNNRVQKFTQNLRKPADRDDLGDLTDARIILKLILGMMIWTGFMWLRIWSSHRLL